MANDKFNWKSLFINDENSDNSKPKELKRSTATQNTTKFPETKTSFPSNSVSSGSVNNALLDKILDMYQTGFDSLNKPGYDFFEFFKAIKAVNSNDGSVYKMALSMAQGVDSKVSKNSLISDANFYITEIKKVHRKYKAQGITKKDQILSIEKNKKSTLINEISSLEKQLLQIQNEISVKKNQLQAVDGTLLSNTSEIDQKIAANDIAKETIIQNIQSVIDGITNNL